MASSLRQVLGWASARESGAGLDDSRILKRFCKVGPQNFAEPFRFQGPLFRVRVSRAGRCAASVQRGTASQSPEGDGPFQALAVRVADDGDAHGPGWTRPMGRPIRGRPSAGWVASSPLRALAICRAPRISASRASCVERSGPVTGLRAGDKYWRRPPSQMPAAVTDQALGAGRGWTIRPRLRRSLRSTGIRPASEEQGCQCQHCGC